MSGSNKVEFPEVNADLFDFSILPPSDDDRSSTFLDDCFGGLLQEPCDLDWALSCHVIAGLTRTAGIVWSGGNPEAAVRILIYAINLLMKRGVVLLAKPLQQAAAQATDSSL